MDLSFMVVLALYLLVGYALVSMGVRLARDKGYTSPWPTVLLLTTLTFGLFLSIIALAFITGSSDLEPAAFSLPFLLLVMEVIAIRGLPRRRRVGGPRIVRFPWHAAGIALSILSVFCLISPLLFPSHPTTLARQVGLLSMLALVAFQLARRKALKPVEQTLEKDARAPVLYLRSFLGEDWVFAERRRVGFVGYLADHQRIQYGLPSERYKTFEGFFSDTFTKTIGPFVGLGNPTDYVPPEGAARTYQDDQRWQDALAQLAERASCIVLPAFRASEGVSWELQFLKKQGLAGKLFILTCALDTSVRRPMRSIRDRPILKRLITAGALNRLSFEKPAPWHELASFLRCAGYAVAAEDPGPGTVLAFDEEGNSSVIVRGARTPSDYVEGIVRCLRARHRSQDAPASHQGHKPAPQPPVQGA